jgi:hypothetical protein
MAALVVVVMVEQILVAVVVAVEVKLMHKVATAVVE